MNIGKYIEKPSSMKGFWTTLADRRRAGPPAFRRKYRKLPYATLSLLLGGRPQRSILTFEGGVGPPARVLYPKFNLRPILQSNPDLENEPIELAEILHAAPF